MRATADTPYRRLFLAAAAFNFVAGLGLILHDLWFDLLGITPYPDNTLFLALFAALVFTFGYGYCMVAGDFSANRSIVTLGAIGKLLVFATALVYFIGGQTSWHLPFITVGYLVFAVLFIRVLREESP